MPVIDIPGMSDTAQGWSAQAREAPASHASFPLIYDDLRRWAAAAMARGTLGQTLQPTALVHEAWLRLSKDANRHWRDRTHLFRAAAQTMRWILLDRVRRRQSAKGGGGAEKVAVDAFSSAAPALNDRLLAVNQCLERLEIEDPESARVITLKFFWGLTSREVAAKLGVSERSVERKWAYAKVSLLDLLQRETGDFHPEGSETIREGVVRRCP